MPKNPKGRPHRHRKRLSGYVDVYDATYPVGEEPIDGLTYLNRRNGSFVPKLTSIPVSGSARRICAILREAGQYNNYDELFLDIALQIVGTKSDPLMLNETVVETLKRAIVQAKIDIGLRKNARRKAKEKQRYHRRKASVY